MYEQSDSSILVNVILGIISFVLFLVFFINFLRMAKNTKLIKEKLYGSDVIETAIIMITEGKHDEAIDIVKKAFLKDCARELKINWFERDKCDENVRHLENYYSRRFKDNYVAINKDFLHSEYLKVRKFYIDEEK